jgi:anaerobic glycerol-3-phosphate dehydrogenase
MKFDVVIIGGGWAGRTAAGRLAGAGLRVCIVSEGLSLAVVHDKAPYSCLADLQNKGVTVLRGDRAVEGIIAGDRVSAVLTRNLGKEMPLEADTFIIATGKFFSRGLLSDMTHIWEPVFGADVAYDADRTKWADPEFSFHQPFMDFGVRTDKAGHVLVSGRPVMNLYAAGEILAAGSKEFDTDSFIEEYEHRIG